MRLGNIYLDGYKQITYRLACPAVFFGSREVMQRVKSEINRVGSWLIWIQTPLENRHQPS